MRNKPYPRRRQSVPEQDLFNYGDLTKKGKLWPRDFVNQEEEKPLQKKRKQKIEILFDDEDESVVKMETKAPPTHPVSAYVNSMVAIYDRTDTRGWYIGLVTDAFEDQRVLNVWWFSLLNDEKGMHPLELKYVPSWIHKNGKHKKQGILHPGKYWQPDKYLVDEADILGFGFQLTMANTMEVEALACILRAYAQKVTGFKLQFDWE
jgi:hypothetical protein